MRHELSLLTRGVAALGTAIALGGIAGCGVSSPRFDEKELTADRYEGGKAYIDGIAQAAGVVTTFSCNALNLEAVVTKPNIVGEVKTSKPTVWENSRTCQDRTIGDGEALDLVSRPA